MTPASARGSDVENLASVLSLLIDKALRIVGAACLAAIAGFLIWWWWL